MNRARLRFARPDRLSPEAERVRRDFDEIARLPEEPWHLDDRYVARLLARVPRGSGLALDLGCGTGRVTRRLAERCDRVIGVDLSPEMIAVARSRSENLENVRYEVADIDALEIPPASVDVVTSVAVLHHLELAETLRRMKAWLAPGGTLLVLDLAWPEGPTALFRRTLAYAVSRVERLRHEGRLDHAPEIRAAWARHAEHDTFHSLSDVRATAARLLPGCRIEPHLLWRYTLSWSREGRSRTS